VFAAFVDDRVAVVGLGLNNVGPSLEYVCSRLYVSCSLLDDVGMHTVLYYICSIMHKTPTVLYQTGARLNDVGSSIIEFIKRDELWIDNSLITLRINNIRAVAINEVGINDVVNNIVINYSVGCVVNDVRSVRHVGRVDDVGMFDYVGIF